MVYKLVITNDATSDLRTLQAYLEAFFGQKAANKVISTIIAQLQQLGSYPKLGASASVIDDQLDNYRYLRDRRNTIFYRIDEDRAAVIIERIFDNRENIIRELNDYLDKNMPPET
ncbi:type II toxin-antitoxin system RelE/ParE family toxin [Lactobacillus sp. LC28-10]|uniref:Type II toxin-antitoxin system RelE/ParE family toxin n=1 Tax=Secundilactobacillus angelensis TaxID=2722706 RepID=A0ABX1KVN7_9LACO|nr:type II toxin-antitoxin system RelE/ParE family toxin [Secundilactobacillus angelensis]NLR17997.1 type II toxin-antitoxin system RelE/ParE family toxin [Secundilactobacillus angelensis]